MLWAASYLCPWYCVAAPPPVWQARVRTVQEGGGHMGRHTVTTGTRVYGWFALCSPEIVPWYRSLAPVCGRPVGMASEGLGPPPCAWPAVGVQHSGGGRRVLAPYAA